MPLLVHGVKRALAGRWMTAGGEKPWGILAANKGKDVEPHHELLSLHLGCRSHWPRPAGWLRVAAGGYRGRYSRRRRCPASGICRAPRLRALRKMTRRFAKGCAILATWRARTSPSTGDMRRDT